MIIIRLQSCLRIFLASLAVMLSANCTGVSLRNLAATSTSRTPVEVNETPAHGDVGLSTAEVEALESLKLIDPYPLYVMEMQGMGGFQALFPTQGPPGTHVRSSLNNGSWTCSLFATLSDPDDLLFGRNFDWTYSPALLLYTKPPEGYASVSIVDLAYLVEPDVITKLDQIDLESRAALLDAPWLPFDGMNETGLAIGMAAVPHVDPPFKPSRPTYDSLAVMRMVLNRARSVEQAIEILDSVNIEWGSGPALHYMIADGSGDSVLVELGKRGLILIQTEKPYQAATNFSQSPGQTQSQGLCERYDTIISTLKREHSGFTIERAHSLLSQVAQPNTQWSVVYDLSNLGAHVRMSSAGSEIYKFHLDPAGLVIPEN